MTPGSDRRRPATGPGGVPTAGRTGAVGKEGPLVPDTAPAHDSLSDTYLADTASADLSERVRLSVERHRTEGDREALSRSIMLWELDRLEHPADEHADPTHLTASAIVVGSRGVVLHRHRRLHRWLQPGGHLEPGETPEEAMARECLEETGLVVTHPPGGPCLIHLDVHRAARGHIHLDLRYLVSAPDLDPTPAPGESQDVAWFRWEDAEDLADVALAGALRSARRLIRPEG